MGDPSNLVMGWRSVMMGMICLPVLICALIFLTRKTEVRASLFLSAFLIVCVLGAGPQIIGYAGFYDVWPGLTFFPLFFLELWLGPLIYLHAFSLMQKKPLGWRKYLLVPGCIQVLYYCWAFWGLGNYQNKWDYNAAFHLPYIIPLESILGILLMGFAIVAIWKTIRTYRKHLDHTSSAVIEYDPVWLRNLIIGIAFTGLLYAGLEILELFLPIDYDTAFPILCLIMAIVAWLSIEAVWRLSKPFPKLPIRPTLDNNTDNVDTRERDWSKEAETLKQQIVDNAWFLEPRLSIRELASRMGTNESYISRMLNTGLNQSFNSFINGLRIEHAQQAIRGGSHSMLAVALDSGFNSKATFNRVFRDMTGMTPTQYRKSQKP